jgi:hypothetical protein
MKNNGQHLSTDTKYSDLAVRQRKEETLMFSRSKVLGFLAGGAAALSFSFGITAEARANNLYVATDGSAYYYSINDAVAAASSGDTIQVAPGTYYGVVKVQGKSNLTIKGQPNAAKPVITLTASPVDYDLVIIEGSHHITFTGFELNGRETLDGNGNVTNVGAGIETNGLKIIPREVGSSAVPSHHITIDGLTVHHLGGSGIVSYIDTDYPSVGNDYITIQSCVVVPSHFWETSSTITTPARTASFKITGSTTMSIVTRTR